jgi:hypothetical protein
LEAKDCRMSSRREPLYYARADFSVAVWCPCFLTCQWRQLSSRISTISNQTYRFCSSKWPCTFLSSCQTQTNESRLSRCLVGMKRFLFVINRLLRTRCTRMIGWHLIDKASDPSDVKRSAMSSRCRTRLKTVSTGHWVSPFLCRFSCFRWLSTDGSKTSGRNPFPLAGRWKSHPSQ